MYYFIQIIFLFFYVGLTVLDSGLVIVGAISLDVLGVTDSGSTALVVNANCASANCGSDSGMYTVPQTTFAVSDRRLKQDIEPVINALNKVTKLKGVYYKWVAHADHKDADNRRHIGLIAQDVQHIVPEAVGQVLGGKMLGVDYEALVPLLIEAVRELSEKLKANRLEIEKLKADHANEIQRIKTLMS